MKRKILNQISTMFTAAIALVAALAWNEAVQSVFKEINFFQDKKVISRFIYAIIITIIAVIVTTIIAKINKDEEQKD